MKRAAVILLAVFMFCASGACVVLWILSLDEERILATSMAEGDWLTADHGQLIYSRLSHNNRYGYYFRSVYPYPGTSHFLNFQWERSAGGNMVAIPLWFGALLFGVTGMTFLFQVTRKEFARGFCRECGYDLRASKVRCPECGSPLAAKAPFEI
jgi:hypothetical protein